jgi:tellurite resistance protein
MAWSDGKLTSEEAGLMIDQFVSLFTTDVAEKQALRQELQDYLGQNIPLEESVPTLKTVEDRELVLKLGYMVIQAGGAPNPDENPITADEKAAYRRLVDLLGLSEDRVQAVEWAADQELGQSDTMIHAVNSGLATFFHP